MKAPITIASLQRMRNWQGPCRVVIDRVMPAVDGGLFAVKRVQGDTLNVQAHIISDGHDTVRSVLQYRKSGERAWNEVAFKELSNDEWTVSVPFYEIGFHEYRVAAWVDHFIFWYEGFQKKLHEGQDMSVELLIGANLLEGSVKRAKGEDRAKLKGFWDTLRSDETPLGARIELACSPVLYELCCRYPDRSRQTCSEAFPLLVERERAVNSSWYEFFPRSCSSVSGQHASFRDAEARLPGIEKMGFNIVYLPPIHPIGHTFRKGKNNALEAAPEDVGSPWAIGSEEGGHKSIHSQLGTFDDFDHFHKRVHELGMELALDIAFQCSPDHPYVKEHPQWFNWRPDGTVQYAENPPKKYQDILPFNFETEDWEALWKELKSVFDFWIERGVKIFRVDNPHTKPLEFWHWCITSIKMEHPEVLFLAEAFTRPKKKYRLAKAGFTQGYTYFTWRNNARDMREYVEELAHGEVSDYFQPNFWPNTPDILHDDIVYGGRPCSIARLVMAATLSSSWGMYGPAFELIDREPFPGKEEYNNNEKYQLKDWDWDAPGNIKSIIARMNWIRGANPALHRLKNILFCGSNNSSLLAYVKHTDDYSNMVLVVVTFDYRNVQGGNIFLPLQDLGLSEDHYYRVEDMLPENAGPDADCNYVWKGGRNYVELSPQKVAHVFRIVR
jgi:starch synthase (maltosyl-transferring)